MNIFKKIFEIMNEYELLLKTNKNENENIINNENNTYNFMNDDFLNYIFKNIHIEKANNNNDNNNENNDNNNINNNNNNNNNSFLLDKTCKNMLYLIVSESCIKENIFKIKESEKIDEQSIINNFLKKIYKKIILKCHPDKNGNTELFLKCKEYYENNFLIGILYIAFILNYQLPELNEIIIKKILLEIRVIQEKIILLKNKN